MINEGAMGDPIYQNVVDSQMGAGAIGTAVGIDVNQDLLTNKANAVPQEYSQLPLPPLPAATQPPQVHQSFRRQSNLQKKGPQ